MPTRWRGAQPVHCCRLIFSRRTSQALPSSEMHEAKRRADAKRTTLLRRIRPPQTTRSPATATERNVRSFLFRSIPIPSGRMLANFLALVARRPSVEFHHGFVEEVKLVDYAPPRNTRVEKIFLACWLLIAGKCWLVAWLVEKYHMRFDALWVNAPTVVFALMCTAIYFLRE